LRTLRATRQHTTTSFRPARQRAASVLGAFQPSGHMRLARTTTEPASASPLRTTSSSSNLYDESERPQKCTVDRQMAQQDEGERLGRSPSRDVLAGSYLSLKLAVSDEPSFVVIVTA
jgi:hypothetical protein